MNGVVKQIHTYTGLLTFVNLMVYGIVGFSQAFHASPVQRALRPAVITERPFTVEPNENDRDVAARVVEELGLSLAKPVHDFVIKHDPAHNLWLDIWDVNGSRKITFLEREHKIRIEEQPSDLWSYLDALHATTAVFKSGDDRLQRWAYYNEFAMWSLLAMTATGVWLWLASRPGHRWALISLAAGASAFCALYALTR